MIKINTLKHVDTQDLRRLIAGYTSDQKYIVSKQETPQKIQFTLELAQLDPPYTKRFGKDQELENLYPKILEQGYSLGAYDRSRLIGLAILEKRTWNNSFYLWELHIEADYQRQGIGTRMMQSIEKTAKKENIRAIALETQNTNLPAINFYHKLGYEIDAVDLSYYTNTDMVDYEVAIFMKRKLDL